MRVYLSVFVLAASICASSIHLSLLAQESAGPQAPPQTPRVVRIPITPSAAPDVPPIPPEEIIRRFSTQEDELAGVVTRYVYRKSVRLQELGADGKTTGQTEVVVTPVVSSDGVRWQRPAGEPESTLRHLNLERDDLDALAKIPLFPFGTGQVPHYQFVYQGKQPVDELTTYLFRVTPKQLERDHAYFDGLIWVDDHDLVIVRTYGKWMTPDGPVTDGALPFTLFETYRQPVENKYWMPAYTRSDSSVEFKGGSAPVRLTIRWDQYQPLPANQLGEPSAPSPG